MKTYCTVSDPENNNLHSFILKARSTESACKRIDQAFAKLGVYPQEIESSTCEPFHFRKHAITNAITINNKHRIYGNMHTIPYLTEDK